MADEVRIVRNDDKHRYEVIVDDTVAGFAEFEADAEGRLVFDAKVLEAVASDAQFVLHEQIRNSILQVVHR